MGSIVWLLPAMSTVLRANGTNSTNWIPVITQNETCLGCCSTTVTAIQACRFDGTAAHARPPGKRVASAWAITSADVSWNESYEPAHTKPC